MQHWRTFGPNIPCQVASPQSRTPFLRATVAYQGPDTQRKYHWTPELCLRKFPGEARRILEPDEPLIWRSPQFCPLSHAENGTPANYDLPSPAEWDMMPDMVGTEDENAA